METVQNMNWNQTPQGPVDDDNMRCIMLERLSIATALGGLEMEKNLKLLYGGCKLRACSFLWSSDPDHQLYKKKVAEYTMNRPSRPAAHNYRGQGVSLGSFMEEYARCFDPSVFRVRIPQGMTRKKLDIMKLTAQFVARYELDFRWALWDKVSTETQFKFLDRTSETLFIPLDRRDTHAIFFSLLVRGYGRLITPWNNPPACMEALLEGFFTRLKAIDKDEEDNEEEVMDKLETDIYDFVVSDEYFVDMEIKDSQPSPIDARSRSTRCNPSRLRDPNAFRVGIPEGGMMRKELGVIKFTAQFVVRYGNVFWDALWDRVSSKAEFQFLKRNPGNDTFFSKLLVGYGCVIQPWVLPQARMKAVLEGFFTAFDAFKGKQEEERNEVVDKVVTDRRDFVVSNEYFQSFLDIERTPLPESSAPPPLPPKTRMMSPPPLHEEEPEPKREKLDLSALVSEPEFLAQHPGSSS